MREKKEGCDGEEGGGGAKGLTEYSILTSLIMKNQEERKG